jgi:hypothetical protein
MRLCFKSVHVIYVSRPSLLPLGTELDDVGSELIHQKLSELDNVIAKQEYLQVKTGEGLGGRWWAIWPMYQVRLFGIGTMNPPCSMGVC